jgi:hypothetical protein
MEGCVPVGILDEDHMSICMEEGLSDLEWTGMVERCQMQGGSLSVNRHVTRLLDMGRTSLHDEIPLLIPTKGKEFRMSSRNGTIGGNLKDTGRINRHHGFQPSSLVLLMSSGGRRNGLAARTVDGVVVPGEILMTIGGGFH